MKTKWVVIAAISAGLVMNWGSTLRAEEGREHAGHEAEMVQLEEAMPTTIGGLWHEIKDEESELGNIIAAKKLDKVHEAAYEIRDYVNAMADKSGDLPADKLENVNAGAKEVAELAEKLDEAGDSGNQAVTEENFEKLKSVLKTIGEQYPAELLSASAQEPVTTNPPALTSDNHEPSTMSDSAPAYTCPMHPEVTSTEAGKCTKCGMRLVPKNK